MFAAAAPCTMVPFRGCFDGHILVALRTVPRRPACAPSRKPSEEIVMASTAPATAARKLTEYFSLSQAR
ncbi:MAG TPA: hypothetical protein VNU21_21255, partial [Usitatibacter sp.]|nr:hypothetical protein [Usitatibacter sp.]